ncbi:MAG TPA: Holliday junction resolvase RuvX [Flavobacteriales bacterium]
MAKALGIDYGLKRTGIAITDDLKMIASPLTTIPTHVLFDYLEKLLQKEKVDVVVIGEAKYLDGNASDITRLQEEFVNRFKSKFPEMKVERINEMFTSKMAAQSLVMSGLKKSDRQKKENIDMVSAAIILQSYLDKI